MSLKTVNPDQVVKLFESDINTFFIILIFDEANEVYANFEKIKKRNLTDSSFQHF